MRYVFFSLTLLVGWISPVTAETTTCPSPATIGQMSFDALNEVSMAACTPQHMLLVIGAAQHWLQDTVIDWQIRADMCLSLLADELQARGQAQELDLKDPTVQFLLDQLAAQQYHLALSQPSDWEKLYHYAEEGEWQYIGKRFFDRGMHYFLLFPLVGGIFAWSQVLRRRRRRSEDTY